MLPQDVSISIEEHNPLFSDSGAFSYPIELSVSQNRELFKSIDSPHGRIRPQDLDGLPFELWYDGVMLLYGSTETDEDLTIEEDKCSINLVSGNGDFQSKIEGMQCTDVPLMGKVLIGHSYPEHKVYIGDSNRGQTYTYQLDEDFVMDFQSNVSHPYDASHPYCNARICVKRTDEFDSKKEVPYWVYEADRSWSGVCFYVPYFIDCLLSHLKIVKTDDHMLDVEDMGRLAFFTTRCRYEYGDPVEIPAVDMNTYSTIGLSKEYMDIRITYGDLRHSNPRFIKREVYATNKNFPETDVSSVIESLFSAFGLKIVHDTAKNEAGIYYIRDILRDNEIIDIPMKVRNVSLSYGKVPGVTISYGGDEQNTSFNYSDWARVSLRKEYKSVLKEIGPYNKDCYILSNTGNKYRIKIDSESEDEGNVKELNPSLFEVAQFNDFSVGGKSDDNEELKIGFSPVIENDVTGFYASKSDKVNLQVLAIYIDEEMKKRLVMTNEKTGSFLEKLGTYDESRNEYTGPYIHVFYPRSFNYDKKQHTESPLQKHDSGFSLGVMRGSGNNSGFEVVIEDYDGNGNDAWVTVSSDYAFTSDTVDAYGNHYDYNGTADGGVSLDGRISLKTHIQTAKDVGLKNPDGTDVDWGIDSIAAKRGLADRFMSEYMYFLLHRKTVTMDVDTTLSQLTSLSWFKQLRINDTVGRLKSRSYMLSNDGVTDMSIELYTIN